MNKIFVLLSILSALTFNSYAQSTDSLKKEKKGSTKLTEQGKENLVLEFYLQAIFCLNVERNLEKTAYLFSKALELDSLHAPSHYSLANILDIKEAIKHSEKANLIDSKNLDYQSQLCDLYSETGNSQSAIRIAKLITETNGNNINAYRNLADIYTRFSDAKSAITVIDTIVSKFGLDEETIMLKLRTYEQVNPTHEIITDLKSITKTFPDLAYTYVVMGEVYLRLGETTAAIENFTKANEIDPTEIKSLINLSEIYFRNNQYDKLFNIVETIFKLEGVRPELKTGFFYEILSTPFFYQNHRFKLDHLVAILAEQYTTNKAVNELIAQHYINGGQLDMAAEHYEKMIANEIDVDMSYRRILGIKTHQKDYAAVIRYADIAAEKSPESKTDFTLSKAYAYMSMLQYKEGLKTVEDYLLTVRQDSVKSLLYGLLGDIYYSKGEKNNCFKNYEKAIKLDPTNINSLNNYAYYLSETGTNLNKALKMATIVIETERENSTYLDTYGWILYKMGRFEDARKALKEAVSSDTTKSPVIIMHYGDVLYKLKEFSNARTYWRVAEKNGASKEEVEKRLALPTDSIK